MDRCKYVLLAKSGKYSVHTCSCGTINVHLDTVTLRISPEDLLQMSTVLGSASARYLERLSRLQSAHTVTDEVNHSNDLSTKSDLKNNTNNDEVIH